MAGIRIAGDTATYRARFDLTDDERRAVARRHATKYRPDAAERWADGLLIALEPAD